MNLGTRGVAEALQLQEYANHPGGTQLSELRRSHGDEDPFGIRLWCLGNEMDGPWQTGAKTARRVRSPCRRDGPCDAPDGPVGGAGGLRQLHHTMPTFGSWEATVLEEAYDLVDYISLHAYYEEQGGDRDCSSPRRRHGVVHRERDRHLRPRRRAAEVARSGSTSPSTSGTSGTSSGVRAAEAPTGTAGPRHRG